MKKRIISILLAISMIAALGFAGATPAGAAGTDDVIAAIEEYNLNHGGVGSLVATVTGANEVTVTGSVTGATEMLRLANGADVKWKATLTGDCGLLIWGGRIEVCEGALLSGCGDSMGCIIECAPLISGGRVEGGIWSDMDRVEITGGNVIGRIIADDVFIKGGTVAGSISALYIELSGGITNVADYLDARFLVIKNDAVLNVASDATVSVGAAYVEPDAIVTNFSTNYVKSLDEYFDKLVVLGSVNRFAGPWPGELSSGYTLTIPKGASLHVPNHLKLSGGVVIIEGTFTYDKSASLDLQRGIIKGKNAGSLAGIYGNALWDMIPRFIQWPLFKALVWLGLDEEIDYILRMLWIPPAPFL